MKRLSDGDLRAFLQAGDAAHEVPELDASERAAIRLAMARAVPATAPAYRWVAVAAALLLGAVATVLWRAPSSPPSPTADRLATAITTRQLDFKTPGGTRLIWVFDTPGSKEQP